MKRGKFGSYLSFLEENFDMPTKSFSYINISTAIDKIENAIFLVLKWQLNSKNNAPTRSDTVAQSVGRCGMFGVKVAY